MKIFRGWNEKTYKAIAKNCGSRQLVRDVSAENRLAFHGSDVYAERIDEAAIIFGYFRKDGTLRIMGLGTTIEARGKGLAAFLLERAFSEIVKRGGAYAETLSKDGVDYYQRHGWEIVGCSPKNEFRLRKNL